jgi:hypothetical protein
MVRTAGKLLSRITKKLNAEVVRKGDPERTEGNLQKSNKITRYWIREDILKMGLI